MRSGFTIGILGGGQLGRMTAEAATRLGIKSHIYTPHSNDCALQIAPDFTVAGFDDASALQAFARGVDVVTYEFENIPVAAVEVIEKICPVYPSSVALRVTQNRIREKSLCRDLEIPTAPWREVTDRASAEATLREFGTIIIKTAEMGYDGKGQWKIKSADQLAEVFAAPRGQLIAEGLVNFDFEISVIVARGIDGEMKSYPSVRNEHKNHILWQTHAPAELPPVIAARAKDYAKLLAEKLNIVGLLAVEMFVVGDDILVNEMAPRPHNSGHWTMEGAPTSQFEQLVRAITGQPLGDVTPRGKFVMVNLIGDDFTCGKELAAQMDGIFHDYGKQEIRPGRKMGHITAKV